MGKYSQAEQDDWLVDYFWGRTGVAVDVGANDGRFFSNTLRLEELGWYVLCIEPNPMNHAALIRNRKHVALFGVMDYDGTADLVVGADQHGPTLPGSSITPYDSETYNVLERFPVPVRTLNTLLDEAGITGPIDFLAMDMEGGEAHALRGLDLDRYAPRLITVEDNHPPKPALPECRAILEGRYREVHRILDDVFFERVT